MRATCIIFIMCPVSWDCGYLTVKTHHVGFEGEVWMYVLMEVDGRNIKWEEEGTLCHDDDHHDYL